MAGITTAIGTRKQVQLQVYGQVKQGTGNTIESITETYNLWADVKRISGNRAFSKGQTQLEEGLYFRVRFRFTYNPDAKYKVIYRGNKHTVKSIEPETEGQFYWIIKADTAHS